MRGVVREFREMGISNVMLYTLTLSSSFTEKTMKLHRTLLLATVIGTLSLVAKASPATAGQWYFWVKNNSDATIQKLLVSEDRRQWGYFDIGNGIAPGDEVKLNWDESTNNEGCNQWIKAQFSDGAESKPAKFNFCKDLDVPIEFQ